MAVLISKLIVALVDQATAPARVLSGTFKDLQASAKSNAMQMDQMRGRMVDAAGAAWALGKALANPIQKAIEFESAMADVAKVSGFSDVGLDDFGNQLRALSTSEIPMAVTELAALAENAAASGIQDSELLDFTRMAAKAALAWGVSGGQAGEDLAKIREALRLTTAETMTYADAINYLSDNTASTAPDLTQFSRMVAAQGEFYGFTKEQTLAFGSAMISAGAEVEVASTSFRNMGKALTIGGRATTTQRNAFKKLGLDANKVAKAMQEDAVGTTMEVIKRLGQLPAEMQASTMGALFGDEARALAPLLGNVELLERTLGLVNDETAYAGSVSEEFARRAQTTEFAMQRLKNQVDGVAIAIGNALLPAINGVAAAIGPMIIGLADFVAANPEIVQAVVALIGGIVGLRVATLATRWAWLFMRGTILDTAVIMGRGAAGILGLINPLNLVKNAVNALRFAFMVSGIGLILVAIAAAGTWIYNNWSGLTAFFEGFGNAFMKAIEPLVPVLQPVIDAGKAMLDWVTGLLGPVDASAEDWTAWGEAVGTAVGESVLAVVNKGKEIIAWFGALPGEIGKALTGMAAVGGQIIQGIWDGAVLKFQEMLTWFSSWPGEILKSIGQIDITKAFVGGPITEPTMGHGGQMLYPVGQVPGVDGARAAGGSIVGGKTYLVGEYGPELITPGRSGYVHDAGSTAGMLGAGGAGGLSLSFGDIIVPGGSDPKATAEAVLQMIKQQVADALSGIYADTEFAG
ncbi:MAG: phage tail tape measure protein [Candidatus Devosia phytovorans]|uniref:Phage tail tape measure protein n=1 Tax=Candidatus Devosia phytovorans TaxID=3121372 RepID=A0AAJ5VTL4_9HYPH|nr:phage tail tape measure protein [Devosia sp.]WEK04574.1 MAG: phage tail tape measure protein [Devosia sp.]